MIDAVDLGNLVELGFQDLLSQAQRDKVQLSAFSEGKRLAVQVKRTGSWDYYEPLTICRRHTIHVLLVENKLNVCPRLDRQSTVVCCRFSEPSNANVPKADFATG